MMFASSSARNCHLFVLTCYVVGTVLVTDQVYVLATSCGKVYPSEYAYLQDSVYTSERSSANCKNYSSGLEPSIKSEYYIHCDGIPLRLTDSDIGSEPYTTSDYYVWTAESRSSQLLFIFPTRVNLTTITLHYYSDNTRGLPRLRFYAVPDDFDVWDAPIASYSYVEVAAVPLGEEPAGHKNVSIEFTVTVAKILMFKYHSTFSLAASEVEFFQQCNNMSTSSTTTEPPSPSVTETTPTTLLLMSTSTGSLNPTTSGVTMSSDPHMTSGDCVSVTIGLRENIAWALVLALSLLLIVSISVNDIHVGLYKLRRSKEGGAVLATKYEMEDHGQ